MHSAHQHAGIWQFLAGRNCSSAVTAWAPQIAIWVDTMWPYIKRGQRAESLSWGGGLSGVCLWKALHAIVRAHGPARAVGRGTLQAGHRYGEVE